MFFETAGPTSRKSQPRIPNENRRRQVRSKVEKVLHWRYMLTTGVKIKSLLKYFAVPKGEDNVQIVYDGTANGLNDAVWVPAI